MIPRRFDTGSGAEPAQGGWTLDAEHQWVVEGTVDEIDDVAAALGPVARRAGRNVLLLRFGNGVGRYRAGQLGVLRVRSGKWTECHYDEMLSDISRRAAALPFHAGAPSALPYSRSELEAPDVLYHAFVWLRHAVLEGEALLVGALWAVVRDPHRHMVQNERVVPADRAVRLSARAIDEIANGVRPFRRVPMGRGLLQGDMFPVEVTETIAQPTTDTAENRFVLAFLRSCGAVLDGMRKRVSCERTVLARRVRDDCDAIEAELAPIKRHRVWEDVGAMRFFPASSTVLQRRSAYREVLRQHILLRMASKALPLDAEEVEHLLEVKDIARLYELWAAFAVVDAVRASKGDVAWAAQPATDELGSKLGCGLIARWSDGTEVAYNVTYSMSPSLYGHSWSVSLRPDVTLQIPSGPSAGLHLLDAKFRLDGTLDRKPQNAEGDAKAGDLHKMHAYRDAIPEARSAWVMYPGTEFRAWCEDGHEVENVADLTGAIAGIGAVPVVPGSDESLLRQLVCQLLGQHDETAQPHQSRSDTVSADPIIAMASGT